MELSYVTINGTAAQGVVDPMSLGMFQSHGDVALRDMVGGHGGDGLRLDLFYNHPLLNAFTLSHYPNQQLNPSSVSVALHCMSSVLHQWTQGWHYGSQSCYVTSCWTPISALCEQEGSCGIVRACLACSSCKRNAVGTMTCPCQAHPCG